MLVNFGYKISKDRQIDFDKNDRHLSVFIEKHEPTFNICISCGTCAATCSAGNFTEFSLRKLIVLIHRGEVEDLKSEITKCMMCGKCTMACPRGVNTRNLILTITKALSN